MPRTRRSRNGRRLSRRAVNKQIRRKARILLAGGNVRDRLKSVAYRQDKFGRYVADGFD